MNKHIIVAVVVIGGLSIWHHYAFKDIEPANRTVTSITVGAFLFMGVVALLDMVPGMSELAGGLAMLAMMTVIINDLPDLLNQIQFGSKFGAVDPNIQPSSPDITKGPH